MVGDVNLFISDIEPDEEEGVSSSRTTTEKPLIQAEIDIMIAEKDQKRRGLGKAATCSMLLYGANQLNIHRFFCKINEDNIASIKLFEGLGFTQCDYAACFKQVELELVEVNRFKANYMIEALAVGLPNNFVSAAEQDYNAQLSSRSGRSSNATVTVTQ